MLIFKSLQIQEIEEIVKLMQEFYAIDNYPIDKKQTIALFNEFISNEKLGQCYLIYNDLELVGYFIITFIFSFEYKGTIAFLDELYIKPLSRKTGIGKKTVDFVKQKAEELNVKVIYLEVENHNQNAQNLYIANDFVFHDRKIMKFQLNKN